MQDSDFSTLFELLPIGAYRSTVDGRQLRANATLVRLNGYTNEAEMLAAINDIGAEWYVDPQRRQRFLELMERDGHVANFRSEVYRHRGRERLWVRENAHVVRDAAGQVAYYEGTVEDVTHAHRTQLAMEASERRFRALTEKAQVLTVVCSADGDVLYASAAAREILGQEPESLRGGNVFDWMHPEDLVDARTEHARAVGFQNSGQESVYRYRHADGEWRYLASLASNCLADPAVQGVVLNFRDATERKQSEQAKLALNQQLTEKTRLLETTLGSISQGICMIDVQGRVSAYNERLCQLLDLPESLLAERPTLKEVASFQLSRGDFGPDNQIVHPLGNDAAQSIAVSHDGEIPLHYMRTSRNGRTLEVRSQMLPAGGMVRTFSDVTDFVVAEQARKRLNLLLEATQSMARVGGWEVDVVRNQVFWTDEVYRILDTSPDQYTPTTETMMQFFTPASARQIVAGLASAARRRAPRGMEVEMRTAKGRPIWVHVLSMVTRENGRIVKRTSVVQDITERRQADAALRESEERWKLALDSSGDGVWDWNLETGEEVLSERAREMYGYAAHEMPTRAEQFDTWVHPDDLPRVRAAREAHFSLRAPVYVNEQRLRCRDGSWKWVMSRGMVIERDGEGRPLRMIGTHTDITNRKDAEAKVWHQANFDALTGLPNRRMLRDRLERDIRTSQQGGLPIAILFIDLDHFKEVNDTLGHDAGDQLLVEAAQRIRGCVRDTDTVARMGGDEFTLVISEIRADERLDRTLEDLLKVLSALFQLGNEQVYVSASIGVTLYPADATAVESLFKNADQALYVAKGAGRNRYSYFTPALQEAAQNRGRLANDLRAGFSEQQFHVVYQPIVDLRSGAVHKAEALIRWDHPTRGPVGPNEFIPIAESSGLIVDIGEWVFRQAAAQAKRWRARHHPAFQISVNKSPVQFHNDAGRLQSWGDHLRDIALGGDAVVVEITEGLLLDTSANVTSQLLQMRDAGIQVSLDDFGTGYSSLTYLQKFDIDYIKIDQSFVRNLCPASTELALCKAIIVMAHELGMRVIAEGVETAAQRDLLAAAGCDYGQGYLFARPMPAAAFEDYLAQR